MKTSPLIDLLILRSPCSSKDIYMEDKSTKRTNLLKSVKFTLCCREILALISTSMKQDGNKAKKNIYVC